jgi:hypothetical protein
LVTSPAPRQWIVPSDLLEQLEKRHRGAPARYRVSLEALPLVLDAQVARRGPVWLDALDAGRLATKGFGAEVLAALERRRQALRELGIAPDDPQRDAKIRDLEQRTVTSPVRSRPDWRAARSFPSTGVATRARRRLRALYRAAST